MKRTFGATFFRDSAHTTVRIIEHGIRDRAHPRPLYTMTQASDTAAWLNERENGYPVPDSLKHMLNVYA